MRRRAAALAIALLGLIVAGRIWLVWAGVYPVGSFLPALSVAIGTGIVVVFAVYVAWRWRFIGGPPLTSAK